MKNKKDLAERVDGELSKLGIRFGSKSDIQKGEFQAVAGLIFVAYCFPVFAMALNTQKAIDTPYVDHAQVDQDVDALHKAGKKKDAVRGGPSQLLTFSSLSVIFI